MNDGTAKQQITDRIKNATNILVTVSTNPSVDELSAALGLTLMLNKFDKHATAVFSGKIPPAITFLDPNKTFENTVDSLRDFIIALDKEKADRLRYRVEDDVVRIFITPYRTRITEEDLQFTHGDFNVELVLALGVESKEVLDQAIAAHGRILHDATVVTINAQNKKSNLGSIDWQDASASSLCEMLVAMGESLEAGLLDEQIATALLTGIVAATNRFSNQQTSPKAMTMAAQLMAAGANQQLIAAKLEETSAISDNNSQAPDGSTPLDEGSSKKVRGKRTDKPKEEPPKKDDSLGEMTIEHDDSQPSIPKTQPSDAPKSPFVPSATIEEHDVRNKKVAGEEALDEALSKLGATTPDASVPDLQEELKNASTSQNDSSEKPLLTDDKSESKSWRSQALTEPSMGGELNATTKELGVAKHKEEESRHQMITDDVPAASVKARTIMPPPSHNETHAQPLLQPSGTLSDIEQSINRNPNPAPLSADAEKARQELSNMFSPPAGLTSTAPPQPPPASPAIALPPPPPLPDFSSFPPPPPVNNPLVAPPLDANGLALPGSPATPKTPPPTPPANEPGQFQIPGQ